MVITVGEAIFKTLKNSFFSYIRFNDWFHSQSEIFSFHPLHFGISCRYVVEKDVKNNVVFISRNYFSLDKRRRLFRVGSLKWLGDSIPIQMSQLRCKVEKFSSCTLSASHPPSPLFFFLTIEFPILSYLFHDEILSTCVFDE